MKLERILTAGVVVCWLELAACSGAQDAAKTVASVTAQVQVIDASAQTIYRSEQEACLGRDDENACLAHVREVFAPIISALQVIRTAWCTLQPSDEGCK